MQASLQLVNDRGHKGLTAAQRRRSLLDLGMVHHLREASPLRAKEPLQKYWRTNALRKDAAVILPAEQQGPTLPRTASVREQDFEERSQRPVGGRHRQGIELGG